MSGSPTSWPIETCVRILRDAPSYRDALSEIQRATGREVTGAALRSVFRRQGLAAPVTFVSGRVANDVSRASVPIGDLDYDSDDFGDTQQTASIFSATASDVASVPAADRSYVDHGGSSEGRASVSGMDMWVVLSDCHIPFEDKAAYELVMRVCRRFKPYGIASIGDFADMLSVSSHPKTPDEMRWQLEAELIEVRKRRAEIDSLGCKRKLITLGNHEGRSRRAAIAAMPSLYDTMDPDRLCEFSAHGWEVYPYQRPAKVGKVHLVHDVGFCGVNTVRANAQEFQASVMCGHTHAAEMRYFGNALGSHHVSLSIGWLGSLDAAGYMPTSKKRANWQHAFAVMYVERETQNTHVQLVPIVDYRCVVGGEMFQI